MRRRRSLSRSSWRIARIRSLRRMTRTDLRTREKQGTMTCIRRRMSSCQRQAAQRSDSKRRFLINSVTMTIICLRTEGGRAPSASGSSKRIGIFPRGPSRGRLMPPRPLKICFIIAARATTRTRTSGRCRPRKLSKAQREWAAAPRSELTSASLVVIRRRSCRTAGRAWRSPAASTTWLIAKRVERRRD